MNAHDLSLKTLIRSVSDELLASRAERQERGLPALFEIQELTVEVSFVVTESEGGGGGFDLKVVRADTSVRYDAQSIHRITLRLRALEEDDLLEDDAFFSRIEVERPLRPRTGEEDEEPAR